MRQSLQPDRSAPKKHLRSHNFLLFKSTNVGPPPPAVELCRESSLCPTAAGLAVLHSDDPFNPDFPFGEVILRSAGIV